MLSRRAGRGFTLIEVLVVVAIIAILAAILFPVFGRARESARAATCISNMHEMYVKVSAYKMDHDRFPCLLFGYAERQDHLPWQSAQDGLPIPLRDIKHSAMYPAYINDVSKFHCPDNIVRDERAVTIAEYPRSAPIYQKLIGHGGHT